MIQLQLTSAAMGATTSGLRLTARWRYKSKQRTCRRHSRPSLRLLQRITLSNIITIITHPTPPIRITREWTWPILVASPWTTAMPVTWLQQPPCSGRLEWQILTTHTRPIVTNFCNRSRLKRSCVNYRWSKRYFWYSEDHTTKHSDIEAFETQQTDQILAKKWMERKRSFGEKRSFSNSEHLPNFVLFFSFFRIVYNPQHFWHYFIHNIYFIYCISCRVDFLKSFNK